MVAAVTAAEATAGARTMEGTPSPTLTAIAHMTETNRWSRSAAFMGTTTSRSSDVVSIASGL